MRGLLIASAFVLVVSAPAAAGTGIAGTYVTTISGQAVKAFDGPWHVRWAAGKETISKGGTTVATGHFSLAGSRITISRESGPLACPGAGVYTWATRGKLLTLKVVRDACVGRRLVLTSHALRRLR